MVVRHRFASPNPCAFVWFYMYINHQIQAGLCVNGRKIVTTVSLHTDRPNNTRSEMSLYLFADIFSDCLIFILCYVYRSCNTREWIYFTSTMIRTRQYKSVAILLPTSCTTCFTLHPHKHCFS